MTQQELTDKESDKLFNEISTAVREQNFTTVNELTENKELNAEEENKNTPDTAIEKMEEEGEEQPEESGKKTPADTQPDDVEGKDKKETQAPEKTDEDKLAEALALIEQVKKENHSLRSQAGRVPSMQRQLQQFDKKLEELTKLATSPSSRPSAKLNEKIAAHLSQIKEADPILAEVMEKVLAEATDGVAEELRNAEIDSLRNQRETTEQEYKEQEKFRLLEMVPNVRDVFSSPSWSKWKEKQTERMSTFIHSDSADDVYFAIQKYAEDMAKEYPELVKTETQEPVEKKDNDEAARIEAERQRKKESAANVGNPNSSGRTQKPDNEDALFKEISERIRKEISG